ncbi:tRNA pseudouridine(13) synthase TruD [Campylobacter sp. 19-13652]|uniref:tRNA pseudouridine(13) synthase TruD n=1 Tax=Campylobacter sp. 19-13652 TaxID=2840180 RepID=UPI001C7617DC|nr:tRNA pseudouridine(13) synthase TruD [Campylobacter sp. 19-13652]BCX79625.1 tRNA pseudouridine synthase D [Campylobacter sp. 19-13652]
MQQENFKPLHALSHAPINVHFSKNSDDFVVREIPLYEPSGNGEWLVLNVQKKGLSTQEALRIFSEVSGAKIKDFGVAGLKDKQGLTTQQISVHKKFQNELLDFSTPELKILSASYHDNKLKVGHLKGNSFFIRLKKVLPADAVRLEQAINAINLNGFANYFGYQRFGKYGDNAASGLEVLRGKKMKNKKMSEFLISAFQSELFNRWLSKRVEISRFADSFSINELCEIYPIDKQIAHELKAQQTLFRLLGGEIMGHYPHGKCFVLENERLSEETQRFIRRDITSCGMLLGARRLESAGFARWVEDSVFSEYYELASKMSGVYRFAWAFLKNLKYEYIEEKAHFTLSFELDKGSYATTVLRELLHSEE